MLPSLLLAIACTPLPTCTPALIAAGTECATPTATIQADHPRAGCAPPCTVPELFRVYAQLEGDSTWPWSFDIPYLPPGVDENGAPTDEAAPLILQGWPVQRVIPSNIENVVVRVMVKAVGPNNLEGAPSEILSYCPSHVWVKPEGYN